MERSSPMFARSGEDRVMKHRRAFRHKRDQGAADASSVRKMLWRMGCALSVLALAMRPEALAQVAPFEGKRIAEIQYSPGQILSPADLTAAQPLKQGDLLHAKDVADAIDGLFATGRFQNIMVEAEPAHEGVIVRFVTQPQWFVGGVDIKGKLPFPPNGAELQSSSQL